MRSPAYQESAYPDRASLRRRIAALVLAFIANALLILMLLGIVPAVTRLPDPRKLSVFQLSPDPGPAPTPDRARAKAKRTSGGAPRPTQTATRAPARPAPDDGPPTRLDMIIIPRDAYAASDISKMRSSSRDAASAGSGSGSGAGDASGAGDTAGHGPGGEKLYNAEWYREPTDAELAGYLPSRARNGWGMIACRTIANYRVEDCVSLGESPSGSGLAEAVRQAAWQFRVQPPRVGAKRLVGEWVRIRIDYSKRARK